MLFSSTEELGCSSTKPAIPPLGSTAASVMLNEYFAGDDFKSSFQRSTHEVDFSIRSTHVSVTNILSAICEGMDVSTSMMKIIESILYVFIARRRGRRFPKKEYGRMVSSWKKTLTTLQEVESDMNHEIDFIKYHLNVICCRAFGSTMLPPKPDCVTKPLFVGWLKRCIDLAIFRKDRSFIYSLLMSKLAWPELTEGRRQNAIKDHKEYICGNRPVSIPDDLHQMIQQTSKNVCGNFVNHSGNLREKMPLPTKFMPTGSACLQASKRELGTASLFDPLVLPERSELGGLRDLNNSLNSWRNASFQKAKQNVQSRIHDRNSGILDVEVQVIPEAGKFRIITKGDGYLYTALQPAQGQLLSAWKKHPSSTMTVDLEEAVNTLYSNTSDRDDWEFSSVDYKSATDLIFKWASNAALLPLTNLAESEIAWQSLQNARVKYPDGQVLDQTQGQLMGHPLSFPLLCILNLACYRCAIMRWVKQDPRRVPDAKILWNNVLVNGDDMLYRAPKSFFEVFHKTTGEAGLKISLGKNYNSQDCALINSQLFVLKNGKMIRTGYLNQRLINGDSLKAGETSATPDLIGKDMSLMIKHCNWAAGSLPKAFSRWGKEWKGWFQPNWFLPVHLGGYGVDPAFAPSSWKITKGQRKMAARFISNERMQLYRRTGFSIQTAKFAGLLASFKTVPASLEGEKKEAAYETRQVEITDDWLVRAAYFSRALQLNQNKTTDKVFLMKVGNSKQRLKPMSIQGLKDWWTVVQIAYGVPECPPLGSINCARPKLKDRLDMFIPVSSPFGWGRRVKR